MGRSASAVFPLIYSHSVRLRFIPNACDTENKYASSCVFAKHSLNHKTVKYLLQNVELIMTQSFREGNSSGMLCSSSRFLWELVLSWNHVLLTVPDCRKYATNNICFVLFSASTPWNHMVIIIIHRVLSLCEVFFFKYKIFVDYNSLRLLPTSARENKGQSISPHHIPFETERNDWWQVTIDHTKITRYTHSVCVCWL